MKKLIIAFLLILFASAAYAEDVYFMEFKGAITSATHKFIQKGLSEAGDNRAVAVVIKLDTPGGLLDATRLIVQEILSSPVPVAVYVSPAGAHAGSAGIFITIAADYAYMAESTNIGAAHPVNISGEDITGDMRTKALNDITSFMRSLAEKRGRNIDEAVLAITESKSFTATEALNAGIIDAIIPNDEELMLDLAERLAVEEALNRVDFAPTPTERLSFFLSNPNTLMLLLFFGILMIFLEFKMPGGFVFAGMGIVAFIVFLFGINLLPINIMGLVLILLGIGLVVAEIFITSFGILAVAGLVSLIIGARLLFDTVNVDGVAVSMSLVASISITVAAIILFVGRLIAKDFKRKSVTGAEELIGVSAHVLKWKDGRGKVDLHGEIWQAISEDDIKENDSVEVLSSEGLTLTVRLKK